MATIEYVGGIEIQARCVEDTVRWYADFGLVPTVEYDGGQYGVLQTAAGPLHFGIVPRAPELAEATGGTICLTFRVSDFVGFVAELSEKGVDPVEEVEDDQGRFAVYLDPEGHKVLAWGD